MILHTRSGVRRGITLLECLTAIFIMGVGLLAILTLFPLGALSMARAVRDDRAAAIGGNAAALANAMDLRNDPNLVGGVAAPGPLVTGPTGYSPAPDGPGYPVLVDPMYAALPGGAVVGASAGSPGIQRIAPSYAPAGTQYVPRYFTFLDEMTFEKTGQPTGGGVQVNRPGTYGWAYLVRRPRPSTAALTEVSVIVYANRPTDAVTGETTSYAAGAYAAGGLGVAGTNTVYVTYSGDKPNLRKGGWVLDTSFRQIGGNATTPTTGTVNGYFYQVAAVTDTAVGELTLELETPLKENVTTLVVLENVITVLERGTNSRP